MRSADERIESMERQVRTYRLLVTLLVVLLVIVQRDRLGRWIDSVEGWFGAVASARADN